MNYFQLHLLVWSINLSTCAYALYYCLLHLLLLFQLLFLLLCILQSLRKILVFFIKDILFKTKFISLKSLSVTSFQSVPYIYMLILNILSDLIWVSTVKSLEEWIALCLWPLILQLRYILWWNLIIIESRKEVGLIKRSVIIMIGIANSILFGWRILINSLLSFLPKI